MQAENISNKAEEKRKKLSPQLDTKVEIEESWTLSSEPKAVKYKEEVSQEEISKRKNYTKDF